MSDDNIHILTPNEEVIVVIFTLTGSLLSLFGACFIIWAYIKFDNLRNFAFKLIFWLSISDFILCAGKLLLVFELPKFPDHLWRSSDTLCRVQSVLINYGGLASITCTVAIAWTLYISLINAELHLETKYESKLRNFCFGLPFIFTLL